MKYCKYLTLLLLALLCCALLIACDSDTAKDPSVSDGAQGGQSASDAASAGSACTAHTYGKWVPITTPTCSAEGKERASCTACGATRERAVAKLDHIAGDWEQTQAPTCTETGTQRKCCKVCKTVLEESAVSAKGHTSGSWITDVAAKCTTTGRRHKACTVCGVTTATETVSALGHTPGSWTTVTPATCTATGSKTHSCTVCRATLGRGVIPVQPHTPGDWIVDVPAKCTTDGSKHKACTACGATTATETIPLKGHTPAPAVRENVIPGSCTSYGSYDSVVYCTDCPWYVISRTTQSDETYVHTYGTPRTVPATCTTPGHTEIVCTSCKHTVWQDVTGITTHTTEFSCEACGYSAFDELARVITDNGTYTTSSSGNYYVIMLNATSTYSETYYDLFYYPTASNKHIAIRTRTLRYDSTNHISDNITFAYSFNFDIYPTQSASYDFSVTSTVGRAMALGSGSFSASAINASTAAIPFSEFKYYFMDASMKAEYETLNASGLRALITNVNAYLAKKKADVSMVNFGFAAFPAAQMHLWSVDAYTQPTCTQAGSAIYSCADCSTILTRTIPALGHDLSLETVTKETSCKEAGSKLLECTRCDHSKTETIPVLPHALTTVVTPPTCTAQGYTTHACENCNYVEISDYVDALGHGLASHYTHTPASCTATGTERYECSRCSYYEDETLPMLAHDYETVSGNRGYYTTKCSDCGKTVTTPISYTITYYLAGGTATNPTTYNIETATFTLANPTREGYTFIGWTGTDVDVFTMTVKITVGSTANRIYTAHWRANTYTVTYDANQGTASIPSDTATYDKSLTLATAERAGYSFVGWYDGDVPFTDGIWKTTENVTLVAKWLPVTYQISYDYAGGSATNQTMYNIESATITLTAPSRTGYTFIGWSGTDLTGLNMNVSIPTGSIGNRSYTANWKANNYTITYDANGGMAAVGSTVVTYDDDYELTTAERVGYDFAGWYADDAEWENGTWTLTQNMTLVAKWTPRSDTKYVVNHHLQNVYDNGYTHHSTESLTGTSDADVTPTVGTCAGFTAPATRTVTVAANGSLVVDYYYTRNSYTVTLISNGGTGTTVTQKYESALAPDTWTAREGFTFGGWFTDVDLTTVFALTKMPSENITIYAWWTEENKPADFTYSGTNTITISGYSGTGTTLWIPMYIGNAPVATIAASAFVDQTTITSVVVPDSVTSIEEGTFKGCNSIENITLPFVGKSADATYYDAVFGYIFGYKTSSYQSGTGGSYGKTFINTKYSSVSGAIWQYSCRDIYVSGWDGYYARSYFYYIPTTIKNVTITKQTTIPAVAFNSCDFIESISLPATATQIGAYAFQNCSILKKLNSNTDGVFNIPDGVTEINEYTFYNCVLVENFTCGNITSIGNYAFTDCTALKKLNGDTENTILLPDTLLTIGDYAFQNVSLVASVIVPNNVISIGLGAFKGCNAITDITLPFVGKSANATYHEAVLGYVFGYKEWTCNDYTNNSSSHDFYNESFGSVSNATWQYTDKTYSFSYLSGMSTKYAVGYRSYHYYIPATIKNITITKQTTIPVAAFNGCDFIENIFLPVTVTEIGAYAFQNCGALTSITFGGKVTDWDTIAKDTAWNTNTGNYIVYCSDGQASKE